MQTNGMVDCQVIFSSPEGTMKNEVKQTVGDRLRNLLRDQGRRDRGAPYTQYELCDMLTGAIEAPNGKRYSIHTSRSVINRYLNDAQEMTYEIITTICEIFHVSADWLLCGEEFKTEEKDQWLHRDTSELAAIVDTFPDDLRQIWLSGAKTTQQLHQQAEQAEMEQIVFLQKIKALLPEQERLQLMSILEKNRTRKMQS